MLQYVKVHAAMSRLANKNHQPKRNACYVCTLKTAFRSAYAMPFDRNLYNSADLMLCTLRRRTGHYRCVVHAKGSNAMIFHCGFNYSRSTSHRLHATRKLGALRMCWCLTKTMNYYGGSVKDGVAAKVPSLCQALSYEPSNRCPSSSQVESACVGL